VVRVAIQALAAVMGGTQSLHTNGFDEAIGLPTEQAARIALRTQQVIASESGVVNTPDPLAGSYFVESLTDQLEALAWEYLDKIDGMGGAVAAIEAGYQMDEIEDAAYAYTRAVDDVEKVIVGVNKYVDEPGADPDVFPIDPRSRRRRPSGCEPSRRTATRRRWPTPRRGPGCGPGHRQPAVPDEGGAAGEGDPRRGERRPARGLRRAPPQPVAPRRLAFLSVIRVAGRHGSPTERCGPRSARHGRGRC
jgi:hypothetical protein